MCSKNTRLHIAGLKVKKKKMEIIHSINDVYAPVAKGHLKSSKIVMSASGVQGSRGRIMARLLT